MARKRVGELLLDAGIITEEQLATALKEQKNTREKLGKILINRGFLNQEKLAEILAQQSGFPLISLDDISLDSNVIKTIPKNFCLNNKVVPLSIKSSKVTLAVADPFDVVTVDLVALMTGCEVELKVATEADILNAVNKFYEGDEEEIKVVTHDIAAEDLPGEMEGVEEIQFAPLFNETQEQDLSKIDTEKIYVPMDTLRLVPREFCVRNKLIPLRKGDNYLLVAIADTSDVVTLDMLKVMTDFEIKTVQFPASAIENLLERLYSSEMAIDELVSIISSTSKLEVVKEDENGHSLDDSSKSVDLQNLRSESETGPVIRLVNSIILNAIKARSSDIHIEPREAATQVRYRIDGLLKNIAFLPSFVHLKLISRFKIMAGMDIAESRAPQDGRCRIRMKKKEYDLRMSTVPTFYGEKLVIRILNQDAASIGLEKLGLAQKDYDAIQTAITAQQGILLVTGPTGSGKSSTLFSILEVLKSETKNIITVEDPIEYDIAGINQIQVNERAGLTFATGLRSILRQDPDVVMVGEIRDEETAEIAFHAAMTGHVVLSTLHTNDAPTTVIRLKEMGLSSYLIAASLKVILAQRLVRTICPDCKEDYPATEEMCDMLGIECGEDMKFYKGKGCKNCGHTGYRGRIGIFEVLVLDDSISDQIYREASISDISEAARRNGMKLLMEDAIEKALSGVTTPEEVLRVISQAEIAKHFKTCPRCSTRVKPGVSKCPKCELTLERTTCPGCGRVLDKGVGVCPYCSTEKTDKIKPLKDMEEPGVPARFEPDEVEELVSMPVDPEAKELPPYREVHIKETHPKQPAAHYVPPAAHHAPPEQQYDPAPNLCPNCYQPVNPRWQVCPTCMMSLKYAGGRKEPLTGRICSICSASLNPEWAACPFCQTPVVSGRRTTRGRCCPFCGEEVENGWNFCPNCHNRIDTRGMEKGVPPRSLAYPQGGEGEIIPFRKPQTFNLSPSVNGKGKRRTQDDDQDMEVLIKKVQGYKSFEAAIVTEGYEQIQKINHINSEPEDILHPKKKGRSAS
ncbi:MAG: Flp pilus assembly complex ATPase component TadA [Chloroflexi bacterium]|nr:Flp pilus assembly complex ATPase component TadA [Chloroflexota bacterium]